MLGQKYKFEDDCWYGLHDGYDDNDDVLVVDDTRFYKR